MKFKLCLAVAGLAALLSQPGEARSQGTVDPEHGIVKVARSLRGLGSVKRVLVIGAHPDDEDTSLLTFLERGSGADAAYLSLNRGEGGQNLIGPELGVGLGLIRSEELLAARRLDGAGQFFTRAYDFGYSKSADETFSLWPRDSVLADVVLVVRRFRPQVIVSVFSGTPRDGHGQHQVAGMLAREAFRTAGDPSRFPEQLEAGLRPWTPSKFYRSTRFDRGATTLELETGELDPLYGRSYHQIAMASRSQHRSQDMGRIEDLGPRTSRLQLLESANASSADDEVSIFAGVDTTLMGLVEALDDDEGLRSRARSDLAGYAAALEEARERLSQWDPAASAPAIARALSHLRNALGELDGAAGDAAYDLRFTLSAQEAELAPALAAAAGIVVDAFSQEDDLLIPGQTVPVEVQLWNGGAESVRVDRLAVSAGDAEGDWQVRLDSSASNGEAVPDEVAAGAMSRTRFNVSIPAAAESSAPYYLRRARVGALYSWPEEQALRALPFDPPLIGAEATLSIAGQSVKVSVPAVYRFGDQARGEVRRPLRVVPALGVVIEPGAGVWPVGRQTQAAFSVSVRSESPAELEGTLSLMAPPGWRVTTAESTFRMPGPGSATTMEFRVEAPEELAPGSYAFEAVAETRDGRRYTAGYSLIDYSHIQRQIVFEDARARIEAFNLALPESPPRIAFIPGAGDAIAEALRAMSLDVEVLDDRAIASADLSSYDAIVLGIRAYETNEALVENNERILDWVRAGGTLIAQYQQYRFFNGDYAPHDMEARRPHDRITDETADVVLLDPEHPVFNAPNDIDEADFEDWVQERGLYFPYQWDERYTPLIEMSDPGEAPKRGALLIAPVDNGLYIYTGLALFRQIPAGVPGAYRLLMNLVSLKRGVTF